ncbi:hypothetical protein ACO0RG_001776 [Hanseniaspora osmophila]|uniref:EKC/KEOPS complex subunit GON7 n=1 Tax=Hanseniaspora osmophila TaxID=56408 RepID=A0A1E5RI69_9ASCO|nr:EKC/KEOPS complex subunit GON7 [Hanseniaspora osmophila]
MLPKVEAQYTNENENTAKVFKITDATLSRYSTTDGKTTGPSEYVIKAGQGEDVDRPSGPKLAAYADSVTLKSGHESSIGNTTGTTEQYTFLSQVRMQLTGIQDDINEFLTEKMLESRGNKVVKQDVIQENPSE